MSSQSEGLMSKTQKGLSILAFETNKQSRILKRRMQIAALQKDIKSDLRALGNLVYNAFINEQKDVMGEADVRILVENIHRNKDEIERIRDMIARLSRAKKHFSEEESNFDPPTFDSSDTEGPMLNEEVDAAAEPEVYESEIQSELPTKEEPAEASFAHTAAVDEVPLDPEIDSDERK